VEFFNDLIEGMDLRRWIPYQRPSTSPSTYPAGFIPWTNVPAGTVFADQDYLSPLVLTVCTWIVEHMLECPLKVRNTRTGKIEENHWIYPFLRKQLEPELYEVLLDMLVSGDGFSWLSRGRVAREPKTALWIPAVEVTYDEEVDRFFHVDKPRTPLNEQRLLHLMLRRDPDNPRTGTSPGVYLAKELMTDDEASNFILTTLRNRGTPWVIMTPQPNVRPPSPAQSDSLESKVNNLSGENSGDGTYIPYPVDVHMPGQGNQIFDMANVRGTPEERVTAAYHVAASVIGLAPGLEQTRVGATAHEQRKASWQDGVLPVQVRVARQLTEAFLVDPDEELFFDISKIQELQRDNEAMVRWVTNLVSSGVMTVMDAQKVLDQEIDPKADVYYTPTGQIVAKGELDTALPQVEKMAGPGVLLPDNEADPQGLEERNNEPTEE